MTARLRTTTLRNLRSTRDLRAGMVTLAAELVSFKDAEGRMILANPVIKEETIRQEWETLLPAAAPEARAGARFDRDSGVDRARFAHPCDVFLSLLDMGLRDQAIQYATAILA